MINRRYQRRYKHQHEHNFDDEEIDVFESLDLLVKKRNAASSHAAKKKAHLANSASRLRDLKRLVQRSSAAAAAAYDESNMQTITDGRTPSRRLSLVQAVNRFTSGTAAAPASTSFSPRFAHASSPPRVKSVSRLQRLRDEVVSRMDDTNSTS